MKLSLLVILALSIASISCTEKSKNEAPPAVAQQQASALTPICKLTRNSKSIKEKSIVIMISVDGLRADYIQKHQPPNISNIIKQGIYTPDMLPSYPSLTFPNHYSLATGRYPGHHGIVSNVFYDTVRKEKYDAFKSATANDGTWYEGEPLWNVVEKNGMIAHTIDWVGSSAHIGQMDPTCYTNYNGKITFAQKVDKALESLALPEETRPHFLTLYTSEVDDSGHATGPYSENTKSALMNVDKEIGRLWNKIQKTNLPISLIVVSDHGMEQLDSQKVIFLDDYIPLVDIPTFQYIDKGAAGLLYNTDPEKIKAAYEALKANEKNFKVYLKGQTPPEFHMDHPSRTGDIIIVPDIPYYITFHPVQGQPLTLKAGTHGWAFENKQMHAFFMAVGNKIAVNKIIPAFQNVDVYPFVLKLLGVTTSVPFDGNPKTLKPYIKK